MNKLLSLQDIVTMQSIVKHSTGVASSIIEIACFMSDTVEIDIKTNDVKWLYVAGLLHDSYKIVRTEQAVHDHALSIGDVVSLSSQSAQKAIHCHGQPVYQPEAIECLHDFNVTVLNMADMTTDKLGKRIKLNDRLNDIATRYGVESQQYKDARVLASKLHKCVRSVKQSIDLERFMNDWM